jgi:hypothetical protein
MALEKRMKKHTLAVLASSIPFVAALALAQGDNPVLQDLKATIALQGYACDEIVNSERNADSDYTATCRDGNRYRVYVNAEGRVIVQKL